ncbi:hypothetical protein FACS1894166_00400 [Bacilli bacterium]|nr:hypothetical protein FACS1894166_00400 [Bacilli bacterium]
MKSLKKISSLIGLTLLAGGVLVAIPFVSTSCGKKTVVTYTLSGTEVSYGHALTITASATNRVGDFT